MAKYQPIKSVKVHRQTGSNAYWVSWSLKKGVSKRKITKKVYNEKKKKTVSTTKKYSKALAGFVIQFYYTTYIKTEKKKDKSTWYLDSAISVGPKTRNTKSQLWTPPDNAVGILIKIKAASKQYKKSAKKTGAWFSADYISKKDKDYDEFPSPPSIAEFKITNMHANALISYETEATGGHDMTGGKVELQVIANSTKRLYWTTTSSGVLKTNSAGTAYAGSGENAWRKNAAGNVGQTRFEFNFPIVGSYQVRARVASNDSGSLLWSEWGGWSSSIDTRPKAPTNIKAEGFEADKIRVSWNQVSNITQYEIEYVADKQEYFDGNMISSVTVNNATSYLISGFESGHTYYFRVRSINSVDRSDPSKIVTAVVAIKPDPPTTWSNTTVGTINVDPTSTKPFYIYWTHNSVDGSAQRSAILDFIISGINYYYYKENTERDDYGELKDEITELNLWDLDVYLDEACTNPAGSLHSIFVSSSASTLKWKAKTKGIHANYSDYSIERSLDIYVQPNLELTVTGGPEDEPLEDDILTAFPLHLVGETTPVSQTPISYYISVISNSEYETTDDYGEDQNVQTGESIFTEYLDTNEQLDKLITASDIDFVSGGNYTLNVTVYMNSGLTAEASYIFGVEWEEIGAIPDATILIDEDYYFADITPFATEYIGYVSDDDEATDDPSAYIGTGITGDLEEPTIVSGSGVDEAETGDMYLNSSTYEAYTCVVGGASSVATWLYVYTFDFGSATNWYSGIGIGSEEEYEVQDVHPDSEVVSAVGNDHYFNTDTGDVFRCTRAGGPEEALWLYVWNIFEKPSANIELSVYRIDAKGRFVTIGTDITNDGQSSDDAISVRDLHPNFGSVTYRIVSRHTETGALTFTDIEDIQSNPSVVLQWDEQWLGEDEDSLDDIPVEPVYTGSILELPANVKLSDKSANDAVAVEYIGRTRPVSYYGTQNGETASITCEFPKEDTDTLDKLRRLMIYMGDVYVREPSGLGYWAQVTVSYNRDFKSTVIPVTLEIRPVEGGM